MAELDDKRTDKLFQVGSERHDFAYNPVAWQRMEGMLEADDRRRKRRIWLLALLGAGLLIALLVAALRPTSSTVEQEEVVVSPEPVAAVAGDEDAVQSDVGETVAVVPEQPRTLPPVENFNHDEPLMMAAVIPAVPVKTIHESSPVPFGGETIHEPSLPVALETIHELSLRSLPPRPLPAVTITPAPAPVPSPGAFRPGLAATVSAGLTSGIVEAGDFGPADTRLGFRLDYRFSDQLSIGGGAYHSKVCYRTDGTTYKADNHVWTNGVVAKDVLADCDILEVPLSLTWHPRGSSRSGPYLGGGLTSYFLRTEQFTFKYDVDDPTLIGSWREDNANRHLFGMGQLNLGYQRTAGRRSAFQVETFVQLPLTDIGHGRVDLFTVGASVNYGFDFRRKGR